LKKLSWHEPLPLFDVAQTRQLESLGSASVGTGPSLMAQAGLAVAKLALAVKPFAPCYWIYCGPGNNGGDGLEAATHLHNWGRQVRVVLWQPNLKRPSDAALALRKVHALGIAVQDELPTKVDTQDLCIDALLGIGLRKASGEVTSTSASTSTSSATPSPDSLQSWIDHVYAYGAEVLAVDVPSGLNANTGQFQNNSARPLPQASHTLQLLTAKPGCLTAHGRDACGTLWLDTLGCENLPSAMTAAASLNTPSPSTAKALHASHKGTFGDVTLIGGEAVEVRGMGMTGAVDLAASAALHAGAGRVMACYLTPDGKASTHAPRLAEIMQRHFSALNLKAGAIVCGCGGGESVRQVLPQVLQQSQLLVLDADALNAIAKDPWLQELVKQRATRQFSTVITPHPLEAARLLNCSSADVQNDRLQAAQTLANTLKCTVVLKGSGTVIAQTYKAPRINFTGNARLATGGTGDVLAGLLGARLAQGMNAFDAACAAVFEHGLAADDYQGPTLTAGKLAELIRGPQTASW
jgi:hydroxyethylthiazole kinase-like uncharacterized protein yjeF